MRHCEETDAVNNGLFLRTICGERLACAEIEADNLRMDSGDYKYIWQASDWPNWRFDLAALAGLMADVSRAQGLLIGRLADIGSLYAIRQVWPSLPRM